MTLLDRIARWAALRRYRSKLGPLLLQRYGRQAHYTPPQVLTTIKLHGLNERFAPLACAMFCSKQAYVDFAARLPKDRPHGAPPDPSPDSAAWLWTEPTWPEHHDAIAHVSTSSWEHGGADHAGSDTVAAFGGHHDGGHHGDHHGGGGDFGSDGGSSSD
jgi:hypothetical protein